MKKIVGLLAFLALVTLGSFAQDADDFGVDGVPLTQAEMDATSGGDAFDLLYAKIEYGKNPYSPNAIRDKGWNAPNDLDNTSVGLINRTHGKNGTESQLKGQMDRAKELDNTALNFFVPVDSAKKIIEGNGTVGDFFDVASSIPGLKFLKGVKVAEKVAEVGRIGNKVEGKAESVARAISKVANDWPELSGKLRQAAKGKGNFGIGTATREQTEAMGKAWVGDGYKIASDGKTLLSANGIRQYRPPTYKPNLGKVQANFEQRFEGQSTNRWQSNAHVDVAD